MVLLPNTQNRNSAPKELQYFALCCGNVLDYLINQKGYNNIKYLTFYNEADQDDYSTAGDFVATESGYTRKEYWSMMLDACKEQNKAHGIDIEYWGCEGSHTNERQAEWIEYFNNKGTLDRFTGHRYDSDEKSISSYFNTVKKAAKDKQFILTECGQNYESALHSFDKNSAQLFINAANLGIGGMLIWCLCGIRFTKPCNFLMNNTIDYWTTPQIEGGINKLNDVYYDWAFMPLFVPGHSKVAKVDCNGKDFRMAAFTFNNDYTVVLEVDSAFSERNIQFKFAQNLNRKFYKYVVERPLTKDGRGMLPKFVGEVNAENCITDKLSKNYQQVIYSTVKPYTQVDVPQVEVFVGSNESYTLSGTVIDGPDGIDYSIAKAIGDFTLSGNVLKSGNVKSGDMCAVKVAATNSKNGAYQIVIVKAK